MYMYFLYRIRVTFSLQMTLINAFAYDEDATDYTYVA